MISTDFDDLLAKAKINLAAAETADEENDDIEAIKESVQGIPTLDPHLDRLTHDAKNKKTNNEFRKIEDPVKVVQQAKLDKENNSGEKWFNMPKPELTPQLKRDLQVLRMRHVWDPKRHYKKNNDPLPKYFHTGTVIQGNTEFFSARIARKDRKKTIAEELMSDTHSYDYYRRKHAEVQAASRAGRSAHVAKRKRRLAKK